MTLMLGMTPREALNAATQISGDLLGINEGVLKPGAPADLLLLDDDLERTVLLAQTSARRHQSGQHRLSTRVSLAGLRLAILGSISWPSPPPGYGPWEQIAYNIAEGMIARGLDVTLFATGNSQTRAKLVSTVPVGLNEDPALNGEVYSSLHIASLFERAGEFDLIHNNFDWKPLTYALATTSPPMLTTIHGFSSPPILGAYYRCAQRSFFCSISDSDRDPGLGYLGTAYNGIDPKEFTFVDRPGDYLVFLGRWHPEKGAHLAIEIAKTSRRPPQDGSYSTRRALFQRIDCTAHRRRSDSKPRSRATRST